MALYGHGELVCPLWAALHVGGKSNSDQFGKMAFREIEALREYCVQGSNDRKHCSGDLVAPGIYSCPYSTAYLT